MSILGWVAAQPRLQATRLAAGGYAARKDRKSYKIELVEKVRRRVARLN